MGQHVTDLGLEKVEHERELKKHAATIHCSNSLSLLQRKISNALLYHAYKELLQKEEHEISVKQLCRLIGYQGHNHAAIKEALKGLISTVIEWNIISDETGAENWTASSIIASVSLQGPLCYYAYSPRMKQLLHSPSMFGKIDLVIQSKFRSSYGLALYENCIRYRGLPQTKWFDMETFKKLMGVPVGMYDIFRDFKRRVLDKAVDEVNMYSDLVITTEFIRDGRKVVKVRFKLKERPKKTRLGQRKGVTALDAPLSCQERLMQEFNISPEQAGQLLVEYGPEYIEEKIAVVKSAKPYQQGRVQNRAGYLLSAIKNNFQAVKPILHEVINLHDAKQELELTELRSTVKLIREEYNRYREIAIHDLIANVELAVKEQFMAEFMIFAEPAIATVLQLQRHKYSRETIMDSPQIQALLRQFAMRELDVSTLPSLEEFVSRQSEANREAWQKLKSYDPDYPLLRFSE